MSFRNCKKKMFQLVLVLSVVFVVPTFPVQAGYWGEPMAAAIWTKMMDRIDRYLEGVLLAKLKSVAIQMLDRQVDQLIGGGAGNSPAFITDFREYIHGVSRDYTNNVMNDFFTTSMRGKYAAANYVEVGSIPSAVLGGSNFQIPLASVIESQMRGAVTDAMPQYDFDRKSSNPGLQGGVGSLQNLNLMVGNTMNNPIGAQLEAIDYRNKTLAEKTELQKIQALSSGYIPQMKNGIVTTPAGTVESLVNNVKDLPNRVIAAASNPEELVGGIVTSFANQMIDRVIQTGIGKTQSMIAQKFGSVGSVLSQTTNGFVTNGLGNQFSREVTQQVGVGLRSMTSPTDAGKNGTDFSFSSQKLP